MPKRIVSKMFIIDLKIKIFNSDAAIISVDVMINKDIKNDIIKGKIFIQGEQVIAGGTENTKTCSPERYF